MDVTIYHNPACTLPREKGTPNHELRLDDPTPTDDTHPILINRPINELGAAGEPPAAIRLR